MLKNLRSAGCVLVLTIASHVALSQGATQPAGQSSGTSAIGTGVITGFVKLGDAPAAGVTLALTPDRTGRLGPQPQSDPGTTNQAVTDEKGIYRFANVAAGRFRVAPLAEAFVVTGDGTRQGGLTGIAVSVSDGQTVADVNFELARGGVITGRVTGGDNRPVIAERINLSTVDANGQLQPFTGNFRVGNETDDRGVYRIYGLPAGSYIISAGGGDRPGVSRRIRYPLTYYPDAVDQTQAKPVDVQSGGVSDNIDIHLGDPIKAYAVTGHAVDADSGQPIFAAPIVITGGRGQGGAGSSGMSNEAGEYSVTGLTPGRYTAAVRSSGIGGGDSISNYYSDPVGFEIAGGNATGVDLKVHQGASILGNVVVDGNSDPSASAQLPQLMVSAISRGGQTQQGQGGRGGGNGGGRQNFGQVGSDGSFSIAGIAPGQVRLSINGFGGGNGFSLVRIEKDGAPLAGDLTVTSGAVITGIRVIVAQGTGVIQGRVIIANGTLPAGSRLTVSVRSLNSTGQNRPAPVDGSGQFRIDGLLPGSYEVRLNASAGGGFGGGGQGGQGGRGGRGGAGQGAGQGGVAPRAQIKIPDVRQTVNVVNGSPSNVTLNLDLSQQ